MSYRFSVVLAFIWFSSCNGQKVDLASVYPNQFGEIAFDESLDSADFGLCDPNTLVHSRVSLNYEGGRKRIEELCKEQVNASNNAYAFNGYILIRFLVNCQGNSDRFRIETLNEGFMPIQCPDGLVSLVENAVRSLDEWTISKPENVGKDHSKYLNFKMVNGRIDAIIH